MTGAIVFRVGDESQCIFYKEPQKGQLATCPVPAHSMVYRLQHVFFLLFGPSARPTLRSTICSTVFSSYLAHRPAPHSDPPSAARFFPLICHATPSRSMIYRLQHGFFLLFGPSARPTLRSTVCNTVFSSYLAHRPAPHSNPPSAARFFPLIWPNGPPHTPIHHLQHGFFLLFIPSPRPAPPIISRKRNKINKSFSPRLSQIRPLNCLRYRNQHHSR